MGNPDEIHSVLENFVDELNSHVETHRLEQLLNGNDTLTSTDTGSQPEAWTRQHLIRPLLKKCGLEWDNEIHGKGQGYPDFGLTNLDILVIGEDKSINKIESARQDIKDYLNNRAASRGAEYGIATDGITWEIHHIELGGDYLDYSIVGESINLQETLLQIARNKNYISQTGVTKIDTQETAEKFYNQFNQTDLNTLLVEEAPRQLRSKKQQGIEEFYDLYVQLLFGEGERDYDYDTTLIDDIDPPSGATETDIRKFAIRLVNRLLFVKFLEDRGIMPEEFLVQRLRSFQDAEEQVDRLGGGLYKTQIEPIFFNLFNTPEPGRASRHRGDWFDQVPYLNGSLFAPDKNEYEYDVDDRILITVVRDLIEGHELEQNGNGDESFDPSILGNVFEMTINHLSGKTDAQKEEGAYYTPGDVIRLITQQSVDPKVYETLVDVYSTRVAESVTDFDESQARQMVTQYDLDEMLKKIEKREGYFSDPDAIKEAYKELGDLKIVDPACGSGHFLTAVLDEVHRVRMSLLRGMQGGNISEQDIYEAKKELMLNAVYGVDVNPVGIEIAKLRVWLKMVEEGWERQFGELPNIDINIVDGNSLIGLPAKSEGQSLLTGFHVDLESIESVRRQYKDGVIDRWELSQRIDELRPELQEIYADNLNHFFEDRVETSERFEAIAETTDTLTSIIDTVRVRKSDDSQFSEGEIVRLDEDGFTTYTYSARMTGKDIERQEELFTTLLEDGYHLEFERRPTTLDIDDLDLVGELSFEPFHWIVEFPEAVTRTENGNGYEVEFDITVGNPPYGNVVSDIERRFTAGYKTGKINEIAAQLWDGSG